MTPFEQLHPSLQHQIVNSLGWRELRPFQLNAIAPLVAGLNAVMLAPTAGGKTEAAVFPVITRAIGENWSGLSILYLCPIKALLNNLHTRLEKYFGLLGRTAALWHGDIKAPQRKKILRNPPDCLLTTPESLEVMLDSALVDSRSLFSEVQVVIVDEVHAFAGDDRGWHLMAVLERLSRLAGRDLQRIGLSATVGNPDHLLDWISGSSSRTGQVLLPPPSEDVPAEVQLDFVGSLANAAVVISRLHRGEKRLVFVDSRARAEQLGAALHELNVDAFVTHSSLSQDQRRQAEEAFASRSNCVIVATSVLELGIDVGDLDRVIQIDSPSTVSSLLQRMGRTGRRERARRNCLLLATSDDALLQAAGLIALWRSGFVESSVPPALPVHVVAQQLMALILQESGIGRTEWSEWLRSFLISSGIDGSQQGQLVEWMLSQDVLWDDHGVLSFAQRGERLFGGKNFLELFSVFVSPPEFKVLNGRKELGYVDEMTFFGKKEGPRLLLLGGRTWKVNHIDWDRKQAYVEESMGKGQSRWVGGAPGLGFELAQTVKQVLIASTHDAEWSSRASERLDEIRAEFHWLREDATSVMESNGEAQWWTFAGEGANACLASGMAALLRSPATPGSLMISFEPGVSDADVLKAASRLRDVRQVHLPMIDSEAADSVKFFQAVPRELLVTMLRTRLADTPGAKSTLRLPVNLHHGSSEQAR